MRASWVLVIALALAGCQKSPAPPAGPANDASANTAPANSAPPTTATSDAADVTAFLDGLYAHYKTNKGPAFDIYGRDAAAVFDPDTVALLKADHKALKGELGAVDGDDLCNCQDWESLTPSISVPSSSATAATADVTVKDTTGDPPSHIAFQLTKTADGWRIHDVKDGDQEWLRKSLTDEIKTLAAGGKSPNARADDDAD